MTVVMQKLKSYLNVLSEELKIKSLELKDLSIPCIQILNKA